DYYYYSHWKFAEMLADANAYSVLTAPPPLTHEMEQALKDGHTSVGGLLVGRPDEVAEQAAALEDALQSVLGTELHFTARLYWPGMDQGLLRETVAIFGAEVMPMLRKDSAQA